MKEECDNNTNPMRVRIGHTDASSNKTTMKRAESWESVEEEQRFYSALMVELNKSQKKRPDQID